MFGEISADARKGFEQRKLQKEYEEYQRKRAEKAEAAPKDGLVTPSTHGR